MNRSTEPKQATPPRLLDRLWRRLAFRGLRRITEGVIEVEDGAAKSHFGKETSLHATVRVRDPRLYRQLLFGGSLGGAAAFVRGEWDCDDLTALFRILARNQAAAEDLDGPGSRCSRWIQQRMHRWHANT